MTVNRKCPLCGVDRGSLIAIVSTRGIGIGLFCPRCSAGMNQLRHRKGA